MKFLPLILVLWTVMIGSASARDFLLVQSTTSTQNSGLYDHLLPQFTAASGIDVRVVAVGTGQALKNAENCDADLLIVHARAREQSFVDDGFGLARHDLMYNDFVVVGPATDPASVRGLPATEALRRIAITQAKFASRGDESGTHIRELALWQAARVNLPTGRSKWYRELGAGMGTTLNIGIELGAYVLTDRGTWLSFENRRDHQILVSDDPLLFNPYGVIIVSPDHCPRTNLAAAQQLQNWLLSPTGRAAINSYRVADEQLFFSR